MSARALASRLKHEQSAGLRNAGAFARRNQLADHVHLPLRAGGEPLDHATRGFMESGFHHDFSRVRLIHARVEAERFGYRHGMPPYQPGYRTARGDPDEAKIRADVTGSSHYNPQDRTRIARRYVGEQETSGWEP
jgi:hypothetical protein